MLARLNPLLMLIVLVTTTVIAESESSDGFNASRLSRIDGAINREIAAGKIAGAVALVSKDGEIAYHKAFGYADIASQTPMKIDAIFRIASMTKAITSVGAMILYERGHFQLNDPISKFLPGFKNPEVVIDFNEAGEVIETRPAAREISISDLLTHSSGISYKFMPQPLQRSYQLGGVIDGLTAGDVELKEGIDRLAEQPLLFDPGDQFAYGLNTDVLGYLVEVISGKSLDQFFQDEIFEPLGMNDTYFYLPMDKAKRLVTLYAEVDGLQVSDGTEADIELDNPRYPIEGARKYFSGGAGLSSTAYDYFRFLEMLRADGHLDGVRVISRKSVELMRTAKVGFDWFPGASFGLGFAIIEDLGTRGEIGSVGSYSWGGAFNTAFWVDPSERLVGIFMAQVRPYTSDISYRFQTAVYQALE